MLSFKGLCSFSRTLEKISNGHFCGVERSEKYVHLYKILAADALADDQADAATFTKIF